MVYGILPSNWPYIGETIKQAVDMITGKSGSGNYRDAVDDPLINRCKKFVRIVESRDNPASLGVEQDGTFAYGLYQFQFRSVNFGDSTISPAGEVIAEYARRSGDSRLDNFQNSQSERNYLKSVSNNDTMIAAQEAVAQALYFEKAMSFLIEHGMLKPCDFLFAYNLWINYGVRYAPGYMAKGTIEGLKAVLARNTYSGIAGRYYKWRYEKILDVAENDPFMIKQIELDWEYFKPPFVI